MSERFNFGFHVYRCPMGCAQCDALRCEALREDSNRCYHRRILMRKSCGIAGHRLKVGEPMPWQAQS